MAKTHFEMKHKFQVGQKLSLSLSLRYTRFQAHRHSILKIRHPADTFEQNIRAYINTLLPTLKCPMVVQTTDGKAMVLKYMSS